MILAHQGGWDEVGLVAAPVALIALLLVLADRRAKKALERQRATTAADQAADGKGPEDGAPR